MHEKETDDKSLEGFDKQGQETNDDKIVTVEKKAQQAIFQSLKGSEAAAIFKTRCMLIIASFHKCLYAHVCVSTPKAVNN